MNKKTLNQYTDLVKEAQKLEKRIERLRKQSSQVSDVVQNGYKRHAVIFGYDVVRDSKLKELEFLLMDRKAKIIIQQTEIENYINNIEESDVRQIFEHRYIDNMNWIQIQVAMGYEHEDTARKKHDRYLEKIL